MYEGTLFESSSRKKEYRTCGSMKRRKVNVRYLFRSSKANGAWSLLRLFEEHTVSLLELFPQGWTRKSIFYLGSIFYFRIASPTMSINFKISTTRFACMLDSDSLASFRTLEKSTGKKRVQMSVGGHQRVETHMDVSTQLWLWKQSQPDRMWTRHEKSPISTWL